MLAEAEDDVEQLLRVGGRDGGAAGQQVSRGHHVALERLPLGRLVRCGGDEAGHERGLAQTEHGVAKGAGEYAERLSEETRLETQQAWNELMRRKLRFSGGGRVYLTGGLLDFPLREGKVTVEEGQERHRLRRIDRDQQRLHGG